MRNSKERKVPEWMKKFVGNDPAKADKLKEHYYYKEPFAESQTHILSKEAPGYLELSPVTLRQYIREKKIFARKINRQWYIPIDAIFRYIYAEENEHQPDKDVPMGFIPFKEISNEKVEEYKIVSDKELRDILDQNLSKDDFYSYFDIDKKKYVIEDLFAANGYSFTEDKPFDDINENIYSFSPKIQVQLEEITKKDDWRKMPVSLMKAKYKEIFNKTPDLNDVRLFRSTIDDIEWNQNKFFLEDAFLAALTVEYMQGNRIIYAYNRILLDVIPEELLSRARYAIEIFEFKGFLKNNIWKGPKSKFEHDLILYYTADWNELEGTPIQDIHEVLEEMVDLVNSPEYKEYEKEYENY
ncbi:MAG: helix-turn-helix domain-containing protein [Candidatus Woesearchaeota archaeon]